MNTGSSQHPENDWKDGAAASSFDPALISQFMEQSPTLGSLPQPFDPASANALIPRTFTPPKYGDIISWKGRKYYVGNQIGTGHFGVVYECTDDWGNDLVAKVLLPVGRTHDQVRKSWQRELTNLVDLRHPNITHVHDAFECRDTFYLIIERCSYTLEQLIEWSDLVPEFWIKPVSRCVLQAIHFMHGANYVHKDIHPRNVFVLHVTGEMGTAPTSTFFKIGDLGISRLEPQIDAFNTVFAQWMLAPEFLDPNAFGRVGKPVDIYHAGLLFLSLLLKKIPTFTREEILAGKPRAMAENLNSPYSAAIAKALRRHVSQRTSSALEFWHDINTCA